MSAAAIKPIGTVTETTFVTPKDRKKNNRLTYALCAGYWSYLGKINILSRYLLNAAAKNLRIVEWSGECFPHHIKNLTTRMKLFSIVSVYFSMDDLSSATQRIFKSMLLNDKEGIALGMLSLTIIATDTFDSITTFVNSTLALASLHPVEAFSVIGLPIAFAIAGLGTISRTINIAKSYNLFKSIAQDVFVGMHDKSKNLMKQFLEAKVGFTDAEKQFLASQFTEPLKQAEMEKLKEKKKAALLRSAPQETVKELEQLLELVEQNGNAPFSEQQLREVSARLHRMQNQLMRKMHVEALGILANVIIIVGLTLLSIGSAGSAPFLYLATGFMIRIVSLIYQDCSKKF